MKIGAHVSTAGGVSNAVDRAEEIGAEAIQMFVSSPRAWAFKPPKEEEVLKFREKADAFGGVQVFIHGSYLVNVGGTPELVEKSIQCLVDNMLAAKQLGAKGVIFHGGSHKGRGFDTILGQATEALRQVLDQSPDDVWLIIENSAGAGDHVGSKFGEIRRMMDGIGSDQVKVCLDTQHAFAAGYDVRDSAKITDAMGEFDREIGLSNLVVVHANDSKADFDSGVDRHENIGDGQIGTDGFEVIMSHLAFKDVPFLLEVPGIEKKGPDKENVDRLKVIRSRVAG